MRLLLALLIAALTPAPQPPSGPAAVPVLVELFTAEGCSSCPPADKLLSVLVKDQPIGGATVIPLGLHVDYWDSLGWKDPASSPVATARQQAYGRVFGEDKIYTPQMVVDGRAELVGSDASEARKAIQSAAGRPHARVSPTATIDGDTLVAGAIISGVPPEAAREPQEAFLAITEDGLTTVVKRGENGGRTLHHDAVMRQVVPLGRASEGSDFRQRVTLRPDWQRNHLNVVVFLQGRKTQRIWGAGSIQVR